MATETGLSYAGNITGKRVLRIRETHVRDHIATLIRQKRAGAAKLDLVLRAIALAPGHTGKRQLPGLVLPRIRYEEIHDLARSPLAYGSDLEDPKVVDAKRKWIAEQLRVLEKLQLLRREPRPGKRPRIVVLRDDGSGDPFDDPDGSPGNSYVRISGELLASGWLADLSASELAFYIAAMIAERYESDRRRRLREGANTESSLGEGQWFRSLSWFAGEDGFSGGNRVLIPFSTASLDRGLRSLLRKGYVSKTTIKTDPVTKRRFETRRRNLYTNHFVVGGLEAQESMRDSAAT